MEKDIGKIAKNDTTEVVVRIDDFGGKKGVTIREFVTSERYTGFTKSGVRILTADFMKFRELINSIDEADLIQEAASAPASSASGAGATTEKVSRTKAKKKEDEEIVDY